VQLPQAFHLGQQPLDFCDKWRHAGGAQALGGGDAVRVGLPIVRQPKELGAMCK
jgi:hypothetical protein